MNENNMVPLKEFVEEYKSLKETNPKAVPQYCQKIIKRKYVPVMEKYASIFAGFNKSNRTADGLTYYNSFISYVVYVMIVVNLYTSIDRGDTDVFDAYDALKECGAIGSILLQIGESELDELERVNASIIKDTRDNEQNIYSFISAQMNKFKDIIEGFVNQVDLSKLKDQIDVSNAESPQEK